MVDLHQQVERELRQYKSPKTDKSVYQLASASEFLESELNLASNVEKFYTNAQAQLDNWDPQGSDNGCPELDDPQETALKMQADLETLRNLGIALKALLKSQLDSLFLGPQTLLYGRSAAQGLVSHIRSITSQVRYAPSHSPCALLIVL